MKTTDEKKLYYFYHEAVDGLIFVDQDGKFVSSDTTGDAAWTVNLDFVSSFFGVTITELFGPDLLPDDPDDDLQMEGFVDEDEISSWLTANKSMIMEAIRRAEVSESEKIEEADEEEFEQTEVVNHVGPVTDAVQQREKEEEKKMSKKKSAKKSSPKKTSAKKKTAKKTVAPAEVVKAAPKKATAKAKKPAKKTPVKGSKPAKKPAKGGGKKKK